jgi:hypothetical protein
MTFRHLPACIWKQLFFLAIYGSCHGSPDIGQVLRSAEEQWSSIQTLSFDLQSKETINPEAWKFFDLPPSNNRDPVLRTYSVKLKSNGSYYWQTDTVTPSTGLHQAISVGSFSEGRLAILFKGEQALLATATLPENIADTPLDAHNPMMEAFSFLIAKDWPVNLCPIVKLNDLHSKDLFAAANLRVLSIAEENFQSKPCIKVSFKLQDNDREIIYFSEMQPGFPLCWQHYHATVLRRETVVTDFSVIHLPSGQNASFPSKLTEKLFMRNGVLLGEYSQTCSNIVLNKDIPDDDFLIDPSLANSIYDRDSHTLAQVPK